MRDLVDSDRIVRPLAHDPDGWASPTNRVLGHVAKTLLEHGIPVQVICQAVEAGYAASKDLP